MSTRVLGPKPRAAWMTDLHRFLGGLATVFTAVHVGALLFDRYVGFGVGDVLVPLHSSYRPVAVAWGVVALYLLVAVEVTSLSSCLKYDSGNPSRTANGMARSHSWNPYAPGGPLTNATGT